MRDTVGLIVSDYWIYSGICNT